MSQKEEIRNWYNTFSSSQKITGVNLRHYTIANKLISLGLTKYSTVLEIGCGIGTLTGLLASFLKKGFLLATDISDESIRIAENRLKKYSNLSFEVTDMSDFVTVKKFDFVVLPDVLEHIPIDQHESLFATIRKHLHQESIVLIHIPHPKAIEYLKEFDLESMQVIDQSLSAEQLIVDAYKQDFILMEYKAYSLYSDEFDYVFISFAIDKKVHINQIPKGKIILKKLINRIIYLLS